MRLLLFLMLSLTFLHSATVFGDIYNAEDFDGLNSTIVKVSGVHEIQFVAKADNYSVELPEGNYTISAYYYENGTLAYYSSEKFRVGKTDARFDLVLFRPGEWEGYISPEVPSIPYEKTGGSAPANTPNTWDYVFYGAVILLLVVIGIVLLGQKKKEKTGGENEAGAGRAGETREPQEIDDETGKIIGMLRANEGRMLQRELRDALKFSETKMSLTIAEMEGTGLVKRIKKGRGNIIKLLKRD